MSRHLDTFHPSGGGAMTGNESVSTSTQEAILGQVTPPEKQARIDTSRVHGNFFGPIKKNLVEDAFSILNEKDYSLTINYLMRAHHSHSIVAGGFPEMS
jgi:hypothetical protein